MRHIANGGSWTRAYEYENITNRLLRNSAPGENINNPALWTHQYTYDPHGSIDQHAPSEYHDLGS